MVEVGVPRVDDQRVFQGEGGNPDVIGGNRCALFAQINVEGGAVVGGCIGGVNRANPWLLQEFSQHSGLIQSTFQKQGSYADFCEDDKRNDHLHS